MIIKKSLVIAGTVASIGLASITGLGLASAQSSTTGGSTLVDKIAAKFNLNKADVQKVFDEDHAAHEAEMQQKQADRLAQAVKDGKLTQDQADKITAKLQELQTQREANRTAMEGKTNAERKAAMDAERTALEQWAKDNNIPLEYLRGLGGPGGHGMRRFDDGQKGQ